MARCHHCGFDLRQAFASEADANMMKLNQEQMQLLKCGHGMIGETCHAVASEYFHELHCKMRFELNAQSVKKYLLGSFYELAVQGSINKREVDFLPIGVRVILISLCSR
jgi:hypothetical protein